MIAALGRRNSRALRPIVSAFLAPLLHTSILAYAVASMTDRYGDAATLDNNRSLDGGAEAALIVHLILSATAQLLASGRSQSLPSFFALSVGDAFQLIIYFRDRWAPHFWRCHDGGACGLGPSELAYNDWFKEGLFLFIVVGCMSALLLAKCALITKIAATSWHSIDSAQKDEEGRSESSGMAAKRGMVERQGGRDGTGNNRELLVLRQEEKGDSISNIRGNLNSRSVEKNKGLEQYLKDLEIKLESLKALTQENELQLLAADLDQDEAKYRAAMMSEICKVKELWLVDLKVKWHHLKRQVTEKGMIIEKMEEIVEQLQKETRPAQNRKMNLAEIPQTNTPESILMEIEKMEPQGQLQKFNQTLPINNKSHTNEISKETHSALASTTSYMAIIGRLDDRFKATIHAIQKEKSTPKDGNIAGCCKHSKLTINGISEEIHKKESLCFGSPAEAELAMSNELSISGSKDTKPDTKPIHLEHLSNIQTNLSHSLKKKGNLEEKPQNFNDEAAVVQKPVCKLKNENRNPTASSGEAMLQVENLKRQLDQNEQAKAAYSQQPQHDPAHHPPPEVARPQHESRVAPQAPPDSEAAGGEPVPVRSELRGVCGHENDEEKALEQKNKGEQEALQNASKLTLEKDKVETQITSLSAKLLAMKENTSLLTAENQKLRANFSELKEESNRREGLLQADLASLCAENDSAKEQLQHLSDEAAVMQKTLIKLESEKRNLTAQMDHVSKEREEATLQVEDLEEKLRQAKAANDQELLAAGKREQEALQNTSRLISERDELEMQIKSLSAELITTQKSTTMLSADYEKMKIAFDEMKEDRARMEGQLQADLANLCAEKDRTKEQLQHLISEAAVMKTTMCKLQDEKRDLTAQVDDVCRERDKAVLQAVDMGRELLESTKSVSNLMQQHEQAKVANDQGLLAAGKREQEAMEKVSRLTSERDELDKHIKLLSTENQKLKTASSELNEESAMREGKLHADLAGLYVEKDRTKEQLRHLIDEAAAMKGVVRQHESEKRDLTAMMDDISRERNEAVLQVANLEGKLHQHEQQLLAFGKREQEALGKVSRLTARKDELENCHADLSAELLSIQESKSQLTVKHNAVKVAFDELKEEIARREDQLENTAHKLEAEVRQMKSKLEKQELLHTEEKRDLRAQLLRLLRSQKEEKEVKSPQAQKVSTPIAESPFGSESSPAGTAQQRREEWHSWNSSRASLSTPGSYKADGRRRNNASSASLKTQGAGSDYGPKRKTGNKPSYDEKEGRRSQENSRRESFQTKPPRNQNLYDALGISNDATIAEIKKAYRKLALVYHPDKSTDPSSADKFREITEAYEVLNDERRRQKYDLSFS